jgi:hypothetical protein
MFVDLRRPGISILLKKNVGRSPSASGATTNGITGSTPQSAQYSLANYAQNNPDGTQTNVIDLTGWLSEHGSVKVTNSVHAGAGIFTITLADKILESVWDTIYSIIEPMDSIEISMAANAYQYAGVGLPIMMRGFVSKVSRGQSMGADGKPHRTVTISGHNYGKLLQMLQLFSLAGAMNTASAAAITAFPFFTRFGFASGLQDSGAFLQTVFSKIVNPYIASMSENPDGTPNQTSPLIPMALDLQTDGEKVSLAGVGTWTEGTVYSLISQYCDVGVWREFFVEDRVDGPYAVFRPKPYVDASLDVPAALQSGAMIMNGVTPPALTQITKADVVSINCERSDENVANYFWVTAPRYTECDGDLARKTAYLSSASSADNTVYVTNYGNVSPALYGTRKMEAATQMAGGDEVLNGNGLNNPPGGNPNQPSYNQSQASQLAWIAAMRGAMIELNRDNVVFEQGEMSLKGNENIRAGTYVQIKNGDAGSCYYAEAVTHEYAPFGNYFTQVSSFSRGTGFIDRTTRTAGVAPYWTEMLQPGGGL